MAKRLRDSWSGGRFLTGSLTCEGTRRAGAGSSKSPRLSAVDGGLCTGGEGTKLPYRGLAPGDRVNAARSPRVDIDLDVP